MVYKHSKTRSRIFAKLGLLSISDRVRRVVQECFDEHANIEVRQRYLRIKELEQALITSLTKEFLRDD